MKAVILAGGYGKRLRPYTENTPKPLVEVAGKPILVWQIEWLKKYGVLEYVILVGYLKEKIIEYLGSGSKLGVHVTYVVEDTPLGTAGALKNAEPFLRNEEVFLVLNGDIITNLDPRPLISALRSGKNVIGAIASVPLRSPYGIIEVDADGFVKSFREKPVLQDYWINAGVYAFTPEIFNYLPERGDIERATFPKLAEKRKIVAVYYTSAYWRSIDTLKDIEEAGRDLTQGILST